MGESPGASAQAVEWMPPERILERTERRQRELLSGGGAAAPYEGLADAAAVVGVSDETYTRTERQRLVVTERRTEVTEPPSRFRARGLGAYEPPALDADAGTTEAYAEDHEVATCHRCDGRGSEACGTCDGDGELGCPTCHGDGVDSDCANCSGGRIRRRDRCSTCDGGGTVEQEQQCTNCGGTGSVPAGTCQVCRNGIVVLDQNCVQCGGEGWITSHKTCMECDGSGTAPTPCEECGATGTLVCDECGGDGSVVCGACDGETELHHYVRVDREYSLRESTEYDPMDISTDLDGLGVDYVETDLRERAREEDPAAVAKTLAETPDGKGVVLRSRTREFALPVRTVRYELSGLGRLWRECRGGTGTYTTAQVGDVVRFDTAPTRVGMLEGLHGGAGDGASSRLRSGAPVPGIDAGGGFSGTQPRLSSSV